MATEVAALVARLEADTRDFQKGLKGAEKRLQKLEGEGRKTRKGLAQTDSSMGKLTTTVKGFAAAAGVAFATKAVLNFARSAVNAASDLGESINAVEVTFGDAAEGIKDLGVEAATAVGLSNAEFNTLAVGFAAFVDKIAEGGDDVVGVMEELTGRAADFASVMNIDVAEAATIFRSGLAGETEPLRKFGIDLSAVTVTAKALALGLAATSSELTEQDKILARFELLMEQTNKTAGDFSNTIDDYANNARVAAADTENLAAVVGESLIPAFQAFDDLKVQAISEIAKLFLNLRIVLVDADEGAVGLAHTLKARVEVAAGSALKPLEGFVEAVDAAATRGQATNEVLAALAEVFQLTAEDAFFLNKEVEASDRAFGKTMLTTGALGRALEQLDMWLELVAQRELLETIPRTQELRDAVLDGADAMLVGADAAADAADAAETLEDKTKRLADIQKKARDKAIALADAERDLRDAYMEAANPIFALAKSIERAAEAEETYNKFVQRGTELTDEGRDAAFDFAAAQADLEASARTLVESGVNESIERLADLLKISEDAARDFLVQAGIMEALDLVIEAELRLETSTFDRNFANALSRLNKIPAFTVPGFVIQRHSGGVIPGPPGADVPAILQAGETVRTVQQERALQTGGSGGGGVSIVVNGFVGSELQLAAQIDKLLTRRSKTSKLGF